MTKLKPTARYLYNVMALGIIASAVFTLFQIIFYIATPYSFWFDYEAVKPTKTEFNQYEDITFNSFRTIKASGINLRWTDVLMCNVIDKPEDKYTRFSADVSTRDNVQASDGIEVASWRYAQQKPTPPRTCYIDSTITVLHPFGITDSQSVKSEIFLIK